ncbi:btb (poz) domain-containing 2a-related [Anaeramoeba flamelloides]|uniref:Btb (Poz) domain-containing 2a-related n=1 Tax=Anaeramoeba flamelloides TaxID=1746091 RepID=A0AAV7YGA8_9EUKA|nr:btb (poz) domain-containing 2a-related [Anaeramoeba flamelloides]
MEYLYIPTLDELIQPLQKSDKMVDLEFQVGKNETKFYGHKLIFALSSPFFEKHLYPKGWQSGTKQVTVVRLKVVSPKIFKYIIEFVYLRNCSLSPRTVFQILDLSLQFQMSHLTKMCVSFVAARLNTSNVLQFLDSSILLEKKLTKCALHFIEDRSQDILTRIDCFNTLKEQTILEILKSDQLQINELELFRRLYERSMYSLRTNNKPITKKNLKNEIKPFLSFLHVDLLGPEGLIEVAQTRVFDSEFFLPFMTRMTRSLDRQTHKTLELSRSQSLDVGNNLFYKDDGNNEEDGEGDENKWIGWGGIYDQDQYDSEDDEENKYFEDEDFGYSVENENENKNQNEEEEEKVEEEDDSIKTDDNEQEDQKESDTENEIKIDKKEKKKKRKKKIDQENEIKKEPTKNNNNNNNNSEEELEIKKVNGSPSNAVKEENGDGVSESETEIDEKDEEEIKFKKERKRKKNKKKRKKEKKKNEKEISKEIQKGNEKEFGNSLEEEIDEEIETVKSEEENEEEIGIKDETGFTKETISKHNSINESNYQIEKKINLQKPIDNKINKDEKKDDNYSGKDYKENDDDDNDNNESNDSGDDYTEEDDDDVVDELKKDSNKTINFRQVKSFKRQIMKNKPNNEIKVLIITTDQDITRIKNVIKSIKCTGIGSVVYINDQTPKFEKIRKYDSIFVYSEINTPFTDSKLLGDTLADYLEDGGGIVLCTYRALIYPSSRGRGSELMGRIVNQYLPIQTGKLIDRGNIGIGKRLIEEHQILNNVTTFHAGHLSSRIEIKLSHPTTNDKNLNNSLQKVKNIQNQEEEKIEMGGEMKIEKNIKNGNGNEDEDEDEDEDENENENEKSKKVVGKQTTLSEPQIIVEWEDGIPLAIVRPGNEDLGTILVLNLWPVSGDGYSGHSKWLYWDPKTDGSFILANSVEYVAKN